MLRTLEFFQLHSLARERGPDPYEWLLLVPVGDTSATQVVGGYLDLYSISWEYADSVHPHLSRAVSEHLVPVFQLHSEHRVRERFHDRPFQDYRILFRLRQ